MLVLTKITGDELHLNPDIIRSIEKSGDTIITLVSGERLLVRENLEEVTEKFMNYKRMIHGVHPIEAVSQ